MLDDVNKWCLSVDSIKAATKKARAEGNCVRGLVFINPGNPTGVCVCVSMVLLALLVKCCLVTS